MKIKKVIVLAGALLSGISLYAQRNSATISGYITDGTSGETLIGAGVLQTLWKDDDRTES